jgi:hypothetical protein
VDSNFAGQSDDESYWMDLESDLVQEMKLVVEGSIRESKYCVPSDSVINIVIVIVV